MYFLALSDLFSGIYSKLESIYFGVFDALDSRGIPVSGINAFFENKGLPAFPIVSGIFLILVLAVIGFTFYGLGPEQNIQLGLVD